MHRGWYHENLDSDVMHNWYIYLSKSVSEVILYVLHDAIAYDCIKSGSMVWHNVSYIKLKYDGDFILIPINLNNSDWCLALKAKIGIMCAKYCFIWNWFIYQ